MQNTTIFLKRDDLQIKKNTLRHFSKGYKIIYDACFYNTEFGVQADICYRERAESSASRFTGSKKNL